jgi:type IV pilus assembly protein PilX
MQYISTLKTKPKQRGVSLLVVIVLVMLSMLLALWGSRTALFNEMIVGNDADYQRAVEAAQALLQDAEFDIQGTRPDGTECQPSADVDICRAGTSVWYPVEDKEVFITLIPNLEAATMACIKGLCAKRTGKQDFWNDKTTLDAMLPAGARYGQFTGAEVGLSTSKASHPILKNTTAGQGGWYWVEVLPYDSSAGNSGLLAGGSGHLGLNLKPNVAYRITAIARGLKPNTQVVLQSTFVRQKLKN